jgi:hypothetical protein
MMLALASLTMGACIPTNNEPAGGIPTIDIPTSTPAFTESPPLKTPTTRPTTTITSEPTQTPVLAPPREAPVQAIPLAGSPSLPQAEISGMAWYGDLLIILPQYPEDYISTQGTASLFAIPKKEILNYLEGRIQEPLETTRISIFNSQVAAQIPGYEGFEAIAVDGEQVYLTIEANYRGAMQGYLIQGNFLSEENSITLNQDTLIEIPTPAQIFNAAYETLIPVDDQVLAMFEANGEVLNPDALAFAIGGQSLDITPLEPPKIEYRLTDATAIDPDGNFWVMNVFVPIEFWYYTISDPIADQFGLGSTHVINNHVERLLELKYNGGQISLSGEPPVYIELIDDANSRNWEAVVRLEDLGFLAMTDTYPETMLGFIPFPDN